MKDKTLIYAVITQIVNENESNDSKNNLSIEQ
jgi:hypothetical protein